MARAAAGAGVITLRLRRSEWCVCARIARLPDCVWTRRGRKASPLTRMHKRGLIVAAGPGLIAMTERGREAYLAHPINWGWADGPANCH